MDPLIKLIPTMNPVGNLIVSRKTKLTFLLLLLFCIPIINNRNKIKLKAVLKIIFLRKIFIIYNYFIILVQIVNFALLMVIFFGQIF